MQPWKLQGAIVCNGNGNTIVLHISMEIPLPRIALPLPQMGNSDRLPHTPV